MRLRVWLELPICMLLQVSMLKIRRSYAMTAALDLGVFRGLLWSRGKGPETNFSGIFPSHSHNVRYKSQLHAIKRQPPTWLRSFTTVERPRHHVVCYLNVFPFTCRFYNFVHPATSDFGLVRRGSLEQ